MLFGGLSVFIVKMVRSTLGLTIQQLERCSLGRRLARDTRGCPLAHRLEAIIVGLLGAFRRGRWLERSSAGPSGCSDGIAPPTLVVHSVVPIAATIGASREPRCLLLAAGLRRVCRRARSRVRRRGPRGLGRGHRRRVVVGGAAPLRGLGAETAATSETAIFLAHRVGCLGPARPAGALGLTRGRFLLGQPWSCTPPLPRSTSRPDAARRPTLPHERGAPLPGVRLGRADSRRALRPVSRAHTPARGEPRLRRTLPLREDLRGEVVVGGAEARPERGGRERDRGAHATSLPRARPGVDAGSPGPALVRASFRR